MVTCASWKQWFDVTAVPVWIVKQLASAVYPAEDSECQTGRYEDPSTHACVYICQEGYEYDSKMRACVATHCSQGYEWDEDTKSCVPSNYKTLRPGGPSPIARKLFTDDSCPVGFYHDHATNKCSPLCADGYKYDVAQKKCVKVTYSNRGNPYG